MRHYAKSSFWKTLEIITQRKTYLHYYCILLYIHTHTHTFIWTPYYRTFDSRFKKNSKTFSIVVKSPVLFALKWFILGFLSSDVTYWLSWVFMLHGQWSKAWGKSVFEWWPIDQYLHIFYKMLNHLISSNVEIRTGLSTWVQYTIQPVNSGELQHYAHSYQQ